MVFARGTNEVGIDRKRGRKFTQLFGEEGSAETSDASSYQWKDDWDCRLYLQNDPQAQAVRIVTETYDSRK